MTTLAGIMISDACTYMYMQAYVYACTMNAGAKMQTDSSEFWLSKLLQLIQPFMTLFPEMFHSS